jgi:hypothetical protein
MAKSKKKKPPKRRNPLVASMFGRHPRRQVFGDRHLKRQGEKAGRVEEELE